MLAGKSLWRILEAAKNSGYLLDIPEVYVELYGDEPRYGGGDEPDTTSLAKSIFIDF